MLQPVIPVDHVVGPGFRIVFMSVLVPLDLVWRYSSEVVSACGLPSEGIIKAQTQVPV